MGKAFILAVIVSVGAGGIGGYRFGRRTAQEQAGEEAAKFRQYPKVTAEKVDAFSSSSLNSSLSPDRRGGGFSRRAISSILTIGLAIGGVAAASWGLALARMPEVVSPPESNGKILLLVDRTSAPVTFAMEIEDPWRASPVVRTAILFERQSPDVNWIVLTDGSLTPQVEKPDDFRDSDSWVDAPPTDMNGTQPYPTANLRLAEPGMELAGNESFSFGPNRDLDLKEYTIAAEGSGSAELSWFAKSSFAVKHRDGVAGRLPAVGTAPVDSRSLAHELAWHLLGRQGRTEGIYYERDIALNRLFPNRGLGQGMDRDIDPTGQIIDWRDEDWPWPDDPEARKERREIDQLVKQVPHPVRLSAAGRRWYLPTSCTATATAGLLREDEQIVFASPATLPINGVVAWRGGPSQGQTVPTRWTTASLTDQNRTDDRLLIAGVLLGGAIGTLVAVLQAFMSSSAHSHSAGRSKAE
ncbi:hypothetical protein [Actinoplanes sp. NPDC089786]|uniref:hypothetical protein n=1 Tax=Actinoplanes sp. NPDC089786 TaxID=3155185 RepID=UPI00344A9F5D